MPGVAGSHHILGIKHLLREFWYCEGSVLLAATGGKRSKTWHEEVESWEWNHVDSKFTEISVQLTWEPETSSDSRHCEGHQMVQVTIRWVRELQCSEADVIESFIVNAVCFICILN
jgi:hypothetical protein